MSTIVKLYSTNRDNSSKWELLPNKLLIVEDIESYLATKTATTINNFQYVKNDLEIGINVEMNQSYSQPKSTLNFKYVSITNNDELTHYYFVKKAIWRSKDCVRFELIMDVLNTFQENRDYTFKENTRIIREHKDRITTTYEKRFLNIAPSDYNIVDELPSINDEVIVYLTFSDIFARGILKEIVYSGEIIQKFVIELDNSYSNEYILEGFQRCIDGDFPAILRDVDTIQDVEMSISSLDEISFSYSGTRYFRKIDYVSEGINPILLRKQANYSIEDKVLLKQNWYLLYRNQENPSESLVNPVECYLIPEEETNVDSGVITSGRITATSLIAGKYYYARIYEENLVGVQLISQSITLPNGTTIAGKEANYGRYIEITRTSGNKLNVILYNYRDNYSVATYLDIDYIQLNNLPFKYVVKDTRQTSNFYLNSMWNNESEWTNTSASNKLFAMSQLDRTDAKNIKLIKLPYCPYNFQVEGGKIAVNDDTNWDYTFFTQSNNINFYALKLNNLNTKLQNNIIQRTNNPLSVLKINNINPSLTNLRSKRYLESKLYHSDFYAPSYVYDSFSFKVELEKCKLDYYFLHGFDEFDITFTMTSTINSKFLFTFASYNCDKANQNFYNVMPIARNNEVVLYNVPYINYIRTGFNYDVKAKNIQNASNFVGLGLSMASVGASLLAPSVPLKIAGVIASLVSVAANVKNTITTTIQNENSLRQKIEQTQNQASSVVGSDDVDLMSEYCGNRLQYILYEPTDIMIDLLADLFFYAGYTSNRMGIPSHNNRVNFDYLECEASIEKIASIPDECLTELINCMKTGITYLHKTSRSEDKWDFEQKYENWERNLIGS
ncbi:MAG: hypothetical protein J6T10_16245 [Methanobrevibacter sp.]|nr:hypothetical protein [Methanobrevibacter sp.]